VGDLSQTRWTLVHAAQAGDAAALDALCRKYSPAVQAWLARRGLGADAEDVGQEALLALLGSALKKATPAAGRFRSLVFAVARHVLLRHHERAGAQKRGAGRVVTLDGFDPGAPRDVDDDFDREWLATLVQSALARLAQEHPPYFEAVRRFVLLEQPQATIAAELGLTANAVKKQVLRGKRKLADYLREEVWSYAASADDYQVELAAMARLLGGGPHGVDLT
jgi:RNA polymerase sigma factor (sigma-70 family)